MKGVVKTQQIFHGAEQTVLAERGKMNKKKMATCFPSSLVPLFLK
jgi:hypothetical protein